MERAPGSPSCPIVAMETAWQLPLLGGTHEHLPMRQYIKAAETVDHLLLHYPFAASFWQRLGIQMEPDAAACNLLHLPKPENLPAAHFDTFVLLCCWHLWKRRNGIVFRQESLNLPQFLQNCKLDARAWSCRLPRQDMGVSDHWCNVLSLAM